MLATVATPVATLAPIKSLAEQQLLVCDHGPPSRL
jgi:hypothetical protein